MLTMTIRLPLSIFYLLLPLIHGKHPCGQKNVQELIKTSPVILKALGANIFADSRADKLMSDNSRSGTVCNGGCEIIVLTTATPAPTSITLTPETFYKGASAMKIVQIADVGEYYEYEGQLNVTIDLSEECFNKTILSLLPTELIVFGYFDSNQSEGQTLIVNDLQKWSSDFESRIWKYLGWDDWSDFTLCSVTCGTGVQQRFRRCLLDSGNSNQLSRDSTNFYSSRLKINEKGNNHGNKKYSTSNKMKRRRRKWKGLSTLSCEGYNIEQRNCNMFECSDDISDLLKFYKKSSSLNETLPADGSMATTSSSATTAPPSTMITNSALISSKSGPLLTIEIDGFLRRWKNPVNFTLMTMLRAKHNQPKGTILSLRNATHHLYLDIDCEGLKLFQERDDVTEMLPIKFNFYDKRWHQIAISVQNGDFIMVYIDCLWKSSFIVSKRLLSLPKYADVVVGRGLNSDIQQLLILPGNYERQQCSTVRTSINEVKRYIIDTFIDDESN